MTRDKALLILGLHNIDNDEDIKKKYRILMKQIHPDNKAVCDYPFEASEINAAYDYLMNSDMSWKIGKPAKKADTSTKKAKSDVSSGISKWNAPVNIRAFEAREIYHKVEDMDGEVIGYTVIDCDKYMWTEEEEFSLFLKSIYSCCRNIISSYDDRFGTDRSSDIGLQANISFLLAQQFVDSRTVLNLNSQTIMSMGDNTYLCDAMVEDIDWRNSFKEGDYLRPYKLIDHKLFLSDSKGKELGYLSFRDDRLYYGVIPLFERRAAQVKIQVTDSEIKKRRGRRYIEVSLMIKVREEDSNQVIEDINGKILELLNR